MANKLNIIPPFWSSPALRSLKGQRCRDVLPLASCSSCVSKFDKLEIKIQWCRWILPFPFSTNHFIMFVHWQEHWAQKGTNRCVSAGRSYDQLLLAASLPFTWLPPPTHTSSAIYLLLFRLFSSSTPTRTNCWEAAFLWQQGRDGGVEHKLHRWPFVCMFECIVDCVCVCVCVCVWEEGGETDWVSSFLVQFWGFNFGQFYT